MGFVLVRLGCRVVKVSSLGNLGVPLADGTFATSLRPWLLLSGD